MYCPKCGNELKNGDVYCPKCGASSKGGGKKKFLVYIVIIAILLIVIVWLLINFSIFRRRIRNSGHFEKVGGVDTYVENGEVVTNTLVRIRGRKVYYVDEYGHKKKNTWAVIDNDGTYGYFGSLGELVTNKIREIEGKKYYFDENGKLVSNNEVEIDGIKYKSNSNGELYTLDEYKDAEAQPKQTVPQTQSIKQTQAVQQTQSIKQTQAVQQTQVAQTTQHTETQTYIQITEAKETTKKLPADGKAEVEETENQGPGVGLVSTYQKSYVTEDEENDLSENETEVKIKSTEKITNTVDDGEYECKITLVRPIMQGKNSDETESINSSIEELMDVMWDEVESVVNDYDTLPKSVTFTTPTLGTVSKTKILINLAGTITTRSGGSKSIKYRITYDREEFNGDITKV